MTGEAAPLKPLKSDKISAGSAPVAPADPAEGLPRRFGRLILLRLLARGGMGEVYLATSGAIEGAERPCVVKIIRREHAEDKSFLARFLDEARIQAQLHHPGVAQIVEAATDETGKPFVVVEHVEGRNLGEVRNRAAQLGARIAWPEALAIGVVLAEALAHVHERTDAGGKPLEIVHRDLSPQNVMVGYGGDVKLIDFGTARGENRRCHTVAGIVFAKPGYVAPEVANNTPGGIPADLYAFGIMLWELCAGRRFLNGEASEHVAAVGAGKRNPTPVARELESPPELDTIIARLTATRIEERYASAREALLDIFELMKRAPSLSNGERSIRARIAHLMQRLYPAEPARSRAEFSRLIAQAKKKKPRLTLPTPSPPPATGDPNLLAGTRYRIVREIGRGATGVVLEAVHVELGRRVALKVLSGEHCSSAAFGEQLRAEARAIARINHENLVALHDFGFANDGRAFYAMELLEGETLDRRLARAEDIGWREAADIGLMACRALAAAHAAGVVHRDIKPANLFLTLDGTLKLLDFGVAKIERGVDAGTEQAEALAIVGTPEYMAPEQVKSGDADPRSDLYALGGVLYELVTGRLPFEAPSTIALLDAKSKSLPEPPRERAQKRGIPPMLEHTIQKALEPNPERRFQSAEEMQNALEEALREPEQKRRRRRRIAYVCVGALVAAFMGVGSFTMNRPDIRARIGASFDKMRGAPPAAAAAAAAPAPAAEEAPSEEAQTAAEPPPAPGNPSEGAETAAAAEAEGGEEAAEEDQSDESATAEQKPVIDADEKAEPGAEAEAKADKAEAKPEPAEPEKNDEMFSGEPVKAESGDKIEEALVKTAELLKSGKKVKAMNEYRRIGRKNRKDPRALRAWSEAAAQLKGWGEALRVAERWVKIDKSVEARMHLAKMQRTVGKREEAIKTLNALLQERPGLEEARAMLKILSPEPRLAQR